MVQPDLQLMLFLHTQTGYEGNFSQASFSLRRRQSDKETGFPFEITPGSPCRPDKIKRM
jgi:hypothetical protein